MYIFKYACIVEILQVIKLQVPVYRVFDDVGMYLCE